MIVFVVVFVCCVFDMCVVGLMLLLCVIWGFQQVVIKSMNVVIVLMFQVGLCLVIVVVLLWGWVCMCGMLLFQVDGMFGVGFVVGVLFVGEFICVFFGLMLMSVLYMVIFLYMVLCFIVFGLYLFVLGE